MKSLNELPLSGRNPKPDEPGVPAMGCVLREGCHEGYVENNRNYRRKSMSIELPKRPQDDSPQTQCLEQLGGIANALDRLEELIQQTEDALGPVLRDGAPVDSVKKEAPQMVPLAERLMSFSDRIRKGTYALEDILGRMEL